MTPVPRDPFARGIEVGNNHDACDERLGLLLNFSSGRGQGKKYLGITMNKPAMGEIWALWLKRIENWL